jgi:hypothetical protein
VVKDGLYYAPDVPARFHRRQQSRTHGDRREASPIVPAIKPPRAKWLLPISAANTC